MYICTYKVFESRTRKSHVIGLDCRQRAHKYPTWPKGLITVSLLLNLDTVAWT